MASACEEGVNCEYGECIHDVCDCLGIFISGEQCEDEMLTHPALYVYITVWLLVYFALLWLMLRELHDWIVEKTLRLREAASQVLLCGIAGHAGWTLFIAMQYFMWDPPSARLSKTIGLFFTAFLTPALTIGSVRVLHVFAQAKAAASGRLLGRGWRWTVSASVTGSIASFVLRVFWLLPFDTQCLRCVFIVDFYHAAIVLMLMQLALTMYGRHVVIVLKEFPDRNARVLEKTKLVTFYFVPMSVCTVLFLAINFFFPVVYGESGVALTLLYDSTRNLMILMYPITLWTFASRRNYTLFDALKHGLFIAPASRRLPVSRHQGVMVRVRRDSSAPMRVKTVAPAMADGDTLAAAETQVGP